MAGAMDGDIIRVTLVRDGAPYQSGTWTADVSSLSPRQREELVSLVNEMDFAAQPPLEESVPYDRLRNTITVERPNGAQSITYLDGEGSDATNRLETWLRTNCSRVPRWR